MLLCLVNCACFVTCKSRFLFYVCLHGVHVFFPEGSFHKCICCAEFDPEMCVFCSLRCSFEEVFQNAVGPSQSCAMVCPFCFCTVLFRMDCVFRPFLGLGCVRHLGIWISHLRGICSILQFGPLMGMEIAS